jgi:protein involved in polysaccharide export with SLBB domain
VKFSKRSVRFIVHAFLAAAAVFALASHAQTSGGDMAELLRNLTPEQQQAILDRVQRSSGSQTDAQLTTPDLTNRPRSLRRDRSIGDQEDQQALGPPRIHGGDTVLLDLRLTITEQQRPQEKRESNAQDQDQTRDRRTPVVTNEPSTAAPEDPVRAAQAKQDLRRRAFEFLPEEQRRALEAADLLREQAMADNPYKLDKDGQIWIPGLRPIALAGLTAEQATERLAREPALELLTARVTLLTLKPLGVESLKPFGYDLFKNLPNAYESSTNMPVPDEYVLGPGDNLEVQFLGNTKGRYTLVVGREGEVRLPDIGPINVAGLRFPEARKTIERAVAEQTIGTRAVVGIGRLRSAGVLVTGESVMPGAYTVSGLSTITNVLALSGGVKPIGSLRKIQLKRNGAVVSQLDLYDLLLHGDSRNDRRVQSGDVVFIPPVGGTVSVIGEIRRPAIYELRADATAGDLVSLGGGLTPEADPRSARIERIDVEKGRVVLAVDLSASGQGIALRSGDILRVDPIRPTLSNAVSVSGHLYRPGNYQYRPGLRLTDVLPSVDELMPKADLHYVLIRRESGPERQVVALSGDLAKAWQQPESAANVRLEPRDKLVVLDLEAGRERTLAPILKELTNQAVRDQPSRTVGVGGRVRMPGQYPLEPGMKVSDLIRAGASIDEAAFGGEAELTRYEVVNGERRQTILVKIDLAKALAGDPSADVLLQPFDYLVVKELSQWSEQEAVVIEGEVQFPGRYPIKRGEALSSVLRRAGGLTEYAFVDGSVFTRKTLREREAKQIESLADRMQRDIAAMSIQTAQVTAGGAASAAQSLVAGQSLLAELRKSQPVGRLVIDLAAVVKTPADSEKDVILKDGDRLVVPRQTQEVTVLGEVQNTTSLLYDPSFSRDDYVSMSGGATQKADKSRIYVVRANGGVIAQKRSRWFGDSGTQIHPGDTIVVPLDAERLPALPFWTAVTTIIYNLAIAATAIARI